MPAFSLPVAHPIIDVEEVFSDFVEDYGSVVRDRVPGKGKRPRMLTSSFMEAKSLQNLRF